MTTRKNRHPAFLFGKQPRKTQMSWMGSARAIAIARFVMVFGHPIEHVILVVEIEHEMIAIR
jgi:hypothetical protein